MTRLDHFAAWADWVLRKRIRKKKAARLLHGPFVSIACFQLACYDISRLQKAYKYKGYDANANLASKAFGSLLESFSF